MNKIVCLGISSCLTTTLVGCATIFGKSDYVVAVDSQPTGANISILDEREGVTIFNGVTPTTVDLKSGAGYFKGKNYVITFTKPGYAKHTAQIEREVSMWYVLGNFVFGGLIGWLIVDPLTGAMWTLPDQVSVQLSPENAPSTAPVPVVPPPGASMFDSTGQQIHIVSLSDIPPELRSKLIRIN